LTLPPSPRHKPPTIHDVARLSGKSKSTVSNVIRNAPGVNPQTRESVQAAIAELGYQLNIVARQLVQQRSAVIGVVVGDLANPFYAEMAKFIENFASSRGFQVMFCNTQVDEDVELTGIRNLIEHRVAGLMFLAYAGDAAGARHVVADRLPVVFVTCAADWGDVVAVDDFAAAAAATRHLIALGHRRIAYFADSVREEKADTDRRGGYAGALADAGLEPLVLRWHRKPHTVVAEGVIVPVETILTGVGRVTAVFAANDLHAIDVLDCADRAGLRVPHDLSIIGFDDVALARIARIGLTTIAQPKEMLAELAVDTLTQRIKGELQGGFIRHSLDFTLISRATTAKAPIDDDRHSA
jgi:LacI family transcriptional regulator